MGNNKQTAVEYIEDKWGNATEWSWEEIKQWFEQAKAIEKEQINKAYWEGYYEEGMYDARKYYDDTYSNTKSE